MDRNSERGIAMVVALFMVLITSVVGTTLMTVSRTETQSTQNYRMMSQARYGAESAIHRAANYLLSNAYTPPGPIADPMTNYVTTVSPVQTAGGDPVVLSAIAADSHYPDNTVITAFANAAQGQFELGDAKVDYRAVARLKSMRQIEDAITKAQVTLQTWEITGIATIAGWKTAGATVEVVSTVERQSTPLYSYAAFATYNGCGALSFAGGATTDSYDSGSGLGTNGKPQTQNTHGNVGTNGNLTEVGNPTMINGSLSTPRQGVGNCSSNNVTAFTGNLDQVASGVNKLSQEVLFPTPPIPAPGSGSIDFKKTGGCGGVPGCTDSADGVTIQPATPTTNVQLGDVDINAGAVVVLHAGVYNVNSLTMNGNSKIVISSGPVIINVTGANETIPLTITGGGIANTTFDPQNLQFNYAGTGEVKLAGGELSSALFYAPNATASISGGADLYGAIVVKELTQTGGAALHYDRKLGGVKMIAGNYMLSAFTWKNY